MNNMEGVRIRQNVYYDGCSFCTQNVIIGYQFIPRELKAQNLDKNVVNKIIELSATTNLIELVSTTENDLGKFKCLFHDKENIVWKYLFNSFAKAYLGEGKYKTVCDNRCCNDYTISEDEDSCSGSDEEDSENEEDN